MHGFNTNERAQRRSRAEWAAEIAQWRQSGLSAGEYAEAHGLKRSTLCWWSSKLGGELSTSSSPKLPGKPISAATPFLPLRVSGVGPAECARDHSAGELEIALPNGLVVRVRGEVSSALLSRVLEVAERGVAC